MKWPNYSDKGTVAGFCSNINGNPHGALHDNVGNQIGMGQVPWAGNDPIFWLHHANIDRIWASWNKSGGKNPNDSAFLNETWVFADGRARASRSRSEKCSTPRPCLSLHLCRVCRASRGQPAVPLRQKSFQLRAASAAPGASAKAIALAARPPAWCCRRPSPAMRPSPLARSSRRCLPVASTPCRSMQSGE
ncbi:tyrosinase family protein [Pseudomonas sp. PCH446]